MAFVVDALHSDTFGHLAGAVLPSDGKDVVLAIGDERSDHVLSTVAASLMRDWDNAHHVIKSLTYTNERYVLEVFSVRHGARLTDKFGEIDVFELQ